MNAQMRSLILQMVVIFKDVGFQSTPMFSFGFIFFHFPWCI
jgi:hypothetical protein